MVIESPHRALHEGLFEAVMAAVVDGMIVIDRTGVVLSYSPSCQQLFGYLAEEVVGQNVKVLMPAPYQAEHDGYLEQHLSTGTRKIIGIGRDVVGLRKDGSTFPMHLSVGVYEEASEPIFVGTIRDLTEIRSAEDNVAKLQNELRHAARVSVMNELSGALSHELNQPLTAITNYLEACRDLLAMPENENIVTTKGLIDDAVQQCLRAGAIIKRAKDFTQKRDVIRNARNVEDVVREACQLAFLGFPAHKTKTSFDFATDLPPVMMDRIQIQQVVLNIIRNALEAMASDEVPDITVRGYRDSAETIGIEVSDSGPGLPAELEKNPFAPFATTKRDGLGMGLSICQSIIRSHGGEIAVTSIDIPGTTFKFTLKIDGGKEHDHG